MNVANEASSLWGMLTALGVPQSRLHGARRVVALAELAGASSVGGELESLRGRNVLLLVRDQLNAALAMIELDGVAQRMVLCTPDLAPEHLPALIDAAQADACIVDANAVVAAGNTDSRWTTVQTRWLVGELQRRQSVETQWVLLTSGTTGAPKLVLHTLASLISAFAGPSGQPPVTWSTFYDIRRYGGLQIFLRSLQGGSLVLSDPEELPDTFLRRAAAAGVTHVSGTPSHWRKALMAGATARIAPAYVRLSGEIADQAVLDSLKRAYPDAVIAHAFASTEAGVAFEVRDGLAGFPAAFIGAAGSRVEMQQQHDTLHIRSPGTALRYLGSGMPPIRNADGFVDTGDRLEEQDGRYYFRGRRGGVINVGGQKVHPEEVEAVINAHPWVHMSLVKARRNAITGAIVTADVVLAADQAGSGTSPSPETLARELIHHCRHTLAAHKVPALIRIVPLLAVSESGKLLRPDA